MPTEVTKCSQQWKVVINGRAHTLSLEKIKELHGKLGEIIIAESRLHPIINRVAMQFGLPPEDLVSKKRTDDLVVARWCVWRLLQKEGLSNSAIGRMTKRNYSTVAYGLRSFTEQHADSKSFRKQVAWLENGAV